MRASAAALVCFLAAALGWSQQDKLGFQRAGDEFLFDTGLLKGKLRAGGKSLGLTEVVHVPSGAAIWRSMGLMGHYRVFTAKRRWGDAAWNWASEAQLKPDKSVEVCWPASAERPFELRAVYRWHSAGSVDVETRVSAKEDLVDFESFLASYFSEHFKECRAYAGQPPNWLAAEPGQGVWQMFPSDARAVGLIQDGRWSFPPSPVNWAIRPPLAAPIGVRRASSLGLTAVIMAPAEDCFAVATPHQTEGHYSLYLSLFGRTIRAGESARARARLVIGAALEEAEILRLYRDYLKELSGR